MSAEPLLGENEDAVDQEDRLICPRCQAWMDQVDDLYGSDQDHRRVYLCYACKIAYWGEPTAYALVWAGTFDEAEAKDRGSTYGGGRTGPGF